MSNVLTRLGQVERELEWRKAKGSVLYFLENYWQIEQVGVGYGKFNPFDYQYEDIASMEESILAKPVAGQGPRALRLKARQIGWTTIATGVAFHNLFFNPHHPWLIASQGQDEAADTLRKKIIQPYLRLPSWFRNHRSEQAGDAPKLVRQTNEVFEFDNGSEVLAIPSTSSAGRSKAVFGVLMDEGAFMENAAELFAALDPLCYGPLWLFSTANGMGNFFHETWEEAGEPDSPWSREFRPWHARPDRDDEWYRNKKLLYRRQEHLFYQEYPSTPTEAFSRSGNAAFDMAAVAEQHWCEPIARYDLGSITDKWYEEADGNLEAFMAAREITDPTDRRDVELHVWRRPEVHRDELGRPLWEPNYVVSVDSAEGLEHGDYTAISVIDSITNEQVATMLAHPLIEHLGALSELLGYWYHVALVMPERNNTGLVPLVYLQKNEYPRLYRHVEPAAIRKGDRSQRYGFHTTNPKKAKMVADLNGLMRGENIIVHDVRLRNEAGVFLADGKGGFGATGSNHDDLVMATLLGVQALEEMEAYPVVWVDPDPGPPTMSDMLGMKLADVIRPERFADEPAMYRGIGQ